MTKTVRTLTFTVVIEVDNEDAEALPEVDGFVDPDGDSQVPMPGIHAVSQYLNDSFVRVALEHFYRIGVHAYMDDMRFVVSAPKKIEHDDDWLY